jgi:hypothetical protein
VLVITDIDGDYEVISISNRGTAVQDMSGWKLISIHGDKKIVYEFPSNYSLRPDKRARVYAFKGEDAWDTLYLRSGTGFGGKGVWGGKGDVAVLLDNRGKEVSRFTY